MTILFRRRYNNSQYSMVLFDNNSTNDSWSQNPLIYQHQCTSILQTYGGLKVLLLLFYMVVTVLAILGNTLIIYIVYSNQSMRTSTNIFIVNMAVCDLGVPLIVLPKRIVELFIGQNVWLIPGDAGVVFCKLVPLVLDSFVNSSTFSLLLITFDRFCAVMFPHKRHLLSKKVVTILICFAWLAAISTVSIFLKIFTTIESNGKTFCTAIWSGAQAFSAYYITLICTNALIPIVFVSVAYTAIFLKLRKQVLIIGDAISDQLRQQEHLRQKKIVKMAFAIVCAFAVCWLPFAVTVLIRLSFTFPYAPCWFLTLLSVSLNLFVLISVTNPAVCFIFGSVFREELCKICRCVFC